MRTILLLAVSVLALLVGCGKKPPAPSVATATNDTTAAAANATAKPVDGQMDPFLTQQLRTFFRQKGRMPADFGELARTSLDGKPRPPAGTRWVIDPTTQEVKAVKQ